MKNYLFYTLLFILTLIVINFGCAREKDIDNNYKKAKNSIVEYTETVATIEVEVAPIIKSHTQSVIDDIIIIDEVVLSLDGWIVVYNDNGEKPGKIIGEAFFKKGTYSEIGMKIDLDELTDKIYLVAHVDRGIPKKFEFPGPDFAMEINGIVPVTSVMLLLKKTATN